MADSTAQGVLPCFVCGKTLQPEDNDHWPLKATVFYTHGHYGSDAFDTMSDRRLEMNVCGPCLKGNSERVAYVEPVPAVRQPGKRSIWRGQYE